MLVSVKCRLLNCQIRAKVLWHQKLLYCVILANLIVTHMGMQVHCGPKNHPPMFFMNNSVKNQPMLIVFRVRNSEEI